MKYRRKRVYLARNGAVGFTGDGARASKGDDGFTRVTDGTGGSGGAWPGFETTRRAKLAGGPPPTGTHSGRGLRRPEHQRRHEQQPHERPGTPKGRVPRYPPLTQPLPRRGSGRLTVSPGDGDASTGTCRQRRPLPGQPRRSDHRSPCAQDAEPHRYSDRWPEPRARRNRSSRR